MNSEICLAKLDTATTLRLSIIRNKINSDFLHREGLQTTNENKIWLLKEFASI